ncbi:MAG: hypothetical protein Q3982_05795, partial [Phoenicibacter congonensis]|nr:hypothetical protein [Phoenicibacter congonensis]
MNSKFAKVFALLLFVVAGLFLAVVALVAVLSTTIYIETDGEVPTVVSLFSHGLLLPLAGIAAGVVVILLMVVLGRCSRHVPKKVVLCVLIALTTLLGLWWVLIQDVDTSRFGDSYRLLQFAKEAAAGNWESFTGSAVITKVSELPDDAHLYFMEYPFQAGIFWYFYDFYCLFGDAAVKALLVANVVADEVTILAILGITKLLGRDCDGSSVVAAALLALCVPLHFSAAFPYGNNIGLCFGSLFLLLQCRAFCAEGAGSKIGNIAASAIPFVLTLMIKSTFILFGIAAVIGWFIYAIKFKKSLLLLSALVVLVVSNTLSSAPVRVLESKAGYSFGDGMPKTSWLMLGSNRSDSTDAAGWWDTQAIEVFLSAEGDKNVQGTLTLSAIKGNVVELIASPTEALIFYFEKLSTEWADPTFEFFVYAGMNAKDFDTFFDPYDALGMDKPAKVLVSVLDGLQICVYVLAFAYLVSLARSGRFFGPQLLLVGTFFTGFGCYLLWEAKGIYLLP